MAIQDDFTIDYVDGSVTFDAAPTGPVTADYSKAETSTWILQPGAGEKWKIEHAELDFTVDVAISKVHFDVWAYNPLFDAGQSPTAESPTWQPGDSGNPLRFLYQRVTYKNYKDILKIANTVEVIEPLPGIANRTLRAVFDYGRSIDLSDAQGMQLRVSIGNETAFIGEWGSITFYIVPVADV